MSAATHILNLIYNSTYLLALILAAVILAGHVIRETARNWGISWSAGDACPHCGKPLSAGIGRSLATLWRTVPWLRCDGWPKCDFSTRRVDIARPAAGNVVSFNRRKGQEMRQ